MKDCKFEVDLNGFHGDFGGLTLEIKNKEIFLYLFQESSHICIHECLLKLTNEQLFLMTDIFKNSLQKDVNVNGTIIKIKPDHIFTDNNENGYIELKISNSGLNRIKEVFTKACAIIKEDIK